MQLRARSRLALPPREKAWVAVRALALVHEFTAGSSGRELAETASFSTERDYS
jgi:hypothetical protein